MTSVVAASKPIESDRGCTPKGVDCESSSGSDSTSEPAQHGIQSIADAE